jgi:hypothetical protein
LWAQWIWHGFSEVFGSLAGWTPLGVLLAVLTVFGIAMRILDQAGKQDIWRALVPALALATGALVFQLITAIGRVAQPMGAGGLLVLGPEYARTSRYIYVVAALTLPLIAVALSFVVQRWRFSIIAMAPLLVVGLVDNVRDLLAAAELPDRDKARHIMVRQLVSDAAYSVMIQSVPSATELRLPAYFSVTAGWLRNVRAQGRLPELGGTTPERLAQAESHLFAQLVTAGNVDCHEAIQPDVMLDVVAGDVLLVHGNSWGATYTVVYESEQGIRVPLDPVSALMCNALKVGAPQARVMFLANPTVERIERCTSSDAGGQ